MDEEQKTVNETGEQNLGSDSSTEEQNTSEVTDTGEQTETTDQSSQAEVGTDEKVSGAQKRIHKLVDERDRYKQEAETLSSKLAEFTAGTQGQPAYQLPEEGGERELTLEDLRTIARLEVEKERTINRINTQAREAIRNNPVLDKDSDQFDPDVNEAVTTAVFNEIQLDPSKDVEKLTEKYLRPYRKAAEKAVGQEKSTLAQQAAETALRPSNVKPVDKSFSEKSIKEMEAELGLVY